MATRNVPALSLRAQVKPSSLNAEKRTVDLVWTTGARVLRTSFWDGPFFEELSLDPKSVRMGRLESGSAPLLDAHDAYGGAGSVLGVVERADIGSATVRFPAEGISPEADKTFALVRDGILKNVSVGYRVYKMEKVEDGADKTPVFRVVDWEPYELSIVPMGADAGAGVRSLKSEFNPCELESSKMDKTSEQIAAEKAAEEKRAAELKASEAERIRAEAQKAERTRVSEIQAMVRKSNLDDSLAQKLITDGSTIDQARAAVIDAFAERSNSYGPSETGHLMPVGRVVDDQKDKRFRGLEAWLHEAAGNGLVAQAKARKLKGFEAVELDGGEFRGMKIVDVARALLEWSGANVRGVYQPTEIIKRALEFRQGGATTSDFAVLFENVMNKQMLAAYAVQALTWQRFCGVETVSDFRDAHRFRNGSFSILEQVAEGEEYKNLAIPDGAKISIRTKKYGKIIAISREALINDDMGALVSLPVRFGEGAARTIEVAIYTLLKENSGLGPTLGDSLPFFDSSRGNISTGAALSIAALDADRVQMRKQKDISSNDYLDLMPRILLVPVGLETSAKLLNTSLYDFTATSALQKPNPVAGMFGDIVSSPRFDWSTTRRYMFTESKDAFKVVFLSPASGGSGEGPVLESRQGFRIDGLEWKARMDFLVNPFDPKTALTNAGT